MAPRSRPLTYHLVGSLISQMSVSQSVQGQYSKSNYLKLVLILYKQGKLNLPVLGLSGREGDPILASQHVAQGLGGRVFPPPLRVPRAQRVGTKVQPRVAMICVLSELL